MSVTVAVSPESASVVVTATVRLKSSSAFAGGVMARPSSWSGVSVAVPSVTVMVSPALLVSVAPSGMFWIETSAASPSWMPVTEMSRGIAVSSSPVAALVSREAMSATPVTETASVALWEAVSLPSVDVAVTVRLKSSASFAGGVMARPSSWSAVSVALPSVMVMVSPALLVSVAPSGMFAISMARLSDASESADVMSSAMALSSEPDAALTSREGVSATASTETASVSVDIASAPPLDSIAMARMVRLNSPLKFSLGISCSPSRSPGCRTHAPETSS